MPLCASVYLCLVVTCWERADFLALACGVKMCLCHIPFGILGQVWYLIVCLFVFVALRPMSTAMVIAGRSVHLTTLFPGQA